MAIIAKRKLKASNVIEVLSELFILKGLPEYIRSDNGSEFIAKKLRSCLIKHKIQTLYIEPGSLWENGYIESFNGKLRDELLKREVLIHC